MGRTDDVNDEELPSLPREELVDLARRFVDAVAAYTRFASVCLFRYRPKEQVFVLLAERGFDMTDYPAPASRLPWDGSLTGLAASRREILSTEDIHLDARVEPATRAALTKSGFVSATTVPVVHRG